MMPADTLPVFKSPAPPHPFLFNRTPPSLHVAVSVVVPVRNEAHHLVQTLDALRRQQDADGVALSADGYEVLLLANNCTDNSFDIARRYQRAYPQFSLHVAQIYLPADQANIGTVRRLLMDEACRRLQQSSNRPGIIASTDGDTVVDRQWVYQIMREIAGGSDAVGGRILTRPDDSPVRVNYLRDVTYRTLIARLEALLDPRPHDPWPRHFQHFGASLAVTCTMYRQAGRLPVVPHLEDEAFYQALLRTDAKIRKSPQVKVTTSSRMQGRVTVGFSEQLRCWHSMNQRGQCQLAEPAEAIITRLRLRHRLRIVWESGLSATQEKVIRLIATEAGVDPAWLLTECTQCRYFGQLWEKLDRAMSTGQWAKSRQPVPITTAIGELRAFLRTVDGETLKRG